MRSVCEVEHKTSPLVESGLPQFMLNSTKLMSLKMKFRF